jgi:hypothetical protein
VSRREVREEEDVKGLLLRLISGSSSHGLSLFGKKSATFWRSEAAKEEDWLI